MKVTTTTHPDDSTLPLLVLTAQTPQEQRQLERIKAIEDDGGETIEYGIYDTTAGDNGLRQMRIGNIPA